MKMVAFVSGTLPSVPRSSKTSSHGSVCRAHPNMVMTWGADAVTTQKKCVVRVEEGNKVREIEVDSGANLRKALLDAKVDLYTLGGKLRNCGGNGACGTCVVDVLSEDAESSMTEMTLKESFLLNGKPGTWRLACKAQVLGDVVIRTKPKQ